VRAEIQALLDRRSDAFMARDRAAFLDTVDPGHKSFRAQQLQMFEGADPIRFGSYRLVANWSRYGDLVRAKDVARYPGASGVSIPLTEERYRVAGFDDEPAVEDVFLTFVERDGEWFVASDTDLDDVGFFSVRHPWDFEPVVTSESEHFLAISRPCSGDGSLCADSNLLDIAEEALARTDQTWTTPWTDKVVLVVPPSGEALQRMIQATFDVDKFVAFAYSTVDPRTLGYVGDRILVNPSVIAGRPRSEVVQIMAHELLHVATRDVSGPFVPLFIDEGLAEVAGYGSTPGLRYFDAIVAGGLFDRTLPEDFQFVSGDGNEIYLSYQEAQSAVRFFFDRWGRERFLRLYRLIGKARIAPGLATWHVERAMRKVTGLGLRGFEKAWASSISS
jgi:hypothetical protein